MVFSGRSDPLADSCSTPTDSSLFMSLKVRFLDEVEGVASSLFGSGSLVNVGNNGGSEPLS